MKKKGSEDSNRKTIAKGTGYSNWNHQGWDVKAYMAAQKEKDRQIWMVLALIMEELKKFRRISAVSTRNLPDLLFEAAGGPGGSVSELASVETVDEERDLEDIRGCKRRGNILQSHLLLIQSLICMQFLRDQPWYHSLSQGCRITASLRFVDIFRCSNPSLAS